MRIAIAQLDTTPGAFEQTIERLVVFSQQAQEQGAELVVFPLMALTGAMPPSTADAPSFIVDIFEALGELVGRLSCPAVVPLVMGFGESDGYYEAMLIDDGKMRPLRAFVRMRNVENHTHEVCEFELRGMRFALAFSTEDLETLRSYDYDVDTVLYIARDPFAMDDSSTAMAASLGDARYSTDAEEMRAWLLGVSSIGGYGDEVYPGGSFVLDSRGWIVATAPLYEEALLVQDVGMPSGSHSYEASPTELEGLYESALHAWQAAALGLSDIVLKQGLSDVALALDGSLSSQVLAVLASDALGPSHVHVVVPSTARKLAPSCRELARRLHIDQRDGTVPAQGFDPADWAQLELAQLARSCEALPLATWDKTALALGQVSTGLNAARFAPLGDVYRSDLLDMAHLRNSVSPVFRRVALHACDALSLTQPDGSTARIATERELLRVDSVLLEHIEYARPLAEIVECAIADPMLAQAVLDACRAAEPLRRCLPPVLVMSTRPVGEASLPLGLAWNDRRTVLPPEDEPPLPIALPLSSPELPDKNEKLPLEDERLSDELEHPHNDALPRHAGDADRTLAMLRDILEQGGLGPLPPAIELKRQSFGEGPGTPNSPSWSGFFSEN